MEHNCVGVRSVCEDGLHSILIDFDNKSLTHIRRAIRQQMEKRHHSDYIIIRNMNKDGHFHTYCPTKVDINEYLAVLEEIGSDPNFSHPLKKWKKKTAILRFHSPTKGGLWLSEVIKSPHRNERMMSFAHLMFLKTVFKLNITPYTNIDNSHELYMDTYKTKKD